MFSLFRTLLTAEPWSVVRIGLVFVLAFSGFLITKELVENVELTVAREARPLLGGDIAISSNEPFSGAIREKLASKLAGVEYEWAEKTEFYTTLFDREGKTGLVRVIATEGAYPLYGVLKTEPVSPDVPRGAMANQTTIERFASGGLIRLEMMDFQVAKRILETSETGYAF